MNSVGVALSRAVAVASDRQSLQAAFDEEWQRIQFAPEAECVVVGVRASIARLWFAGRLNDLELALAACDPPEAIFWMGLPNRRSYAAGLREARRLVTAGARFCVSFCPFPNVIDHCLRVGHVGRVAAHGTYLLCEGEALRRWLKVTPPP